MERDERDGSSNRHRKEAEGPGGEVWFRVFNALCYAVFTSAMVLWLYHLFLVCGGPGNAVIPPSIWGFLEPYASRGVWFALGAAFLANFVGLATGRETFFSR
jgi:hypothetical protein